MVKHILKPNKRRSFGFIKSMARPEAARGVAEASWCPEDAEIPPSPQRIRLRILGLVG